MNQLSPNAKLVMHDDYLISAKQISSKKKYDENIFELKRIRQSDNELNQNKKPSCGLADIIKSLKALIINDEFFIL